MCKIKNCPDLRSDLCFRHAMEVDDLVEYFLDEKYTNEKILECLKEYSYLYKKENHIYRIEDRWINSGSIYELCMQLPIVYDYTNRIILEECVLSTFGDKSFNVICNHIIQNIKYKLVY